MAEPVMVSGMVLSAMPIGEYDRRIVLLTADRGKINGFARGARRPGSNMMAASQPFVYGDFMVYEGKNSYTFASAKVVEYFEELRKDVEAVCYGSYFLELADYYARENEDDLQILSLLYLAVRALIKKKVPFPLIRAVFELRMLVINGECPEFFHCCKCGRQDDLTVFSARNHGMLCREHEREGGMRAVRMGGGALYAAKFIVTRPVKELFTFTLSEEALSQLRRMLDAYLNMMTDRKFKSLEMLTFLTEIS